MSYVTPGSYAFNSATDPRGTPGNYSPGSRNTYYGAENPATRHGDGKENDWELKGVGSASALGGNPQFKWERKQAPPASGSTAAPAAPKSNPLPTPTPPKLLSSASANDAFSRSQAYLRQQGASQEPGASYFQQADQQKQIARFDANKMADQFTQQALNQGAEIRYGIQKAASDLPSDLALSKPLSQTDALAYARQLADLVKST
jgi:hypothetical protein